MDSRLESKVAVLRSLFLRFRGGRDKEVALKELEQQTYLENTG